MMDTATILTRLDAMLAEAPWNNRAFPADVLLIFADAADADARTLDHGAPVLAEERRALATGLRNRASRARTLAGVLTPMEQHPHAIPCNQAPDLLRRDHGGRCA